MRPILTGLTILFLFFLRLQINPKLNLINGQRVRVTGVLREEPQVSGNQQKFKLGQFEVVTNKWPEFHYGDEIEVTGKLKRQSISRGGSLDSLRSLGMTFLLGEKYLLSYPEVGEMAEGERRLKSASTKTLNIQKAAIWLRGRMLEVYKRIFPPTFDGIIAGVVLGDKSLISRDFWEKLKATGTLHILVASGMNIAMFAPGLLETLCAIFVRRISLLVLISLIWFYTLMAGFQPPIVRAAIMASLLYLGQFFGRETEGKRILWTTGVLMIFVSPELIFDIGFQLSFLATAGLVYIQPIIKNSVIARRRETTTKQSRRDVFKLNGIATPGVAWLAMTLRNDNFTSSISAQIATLPILLLSFGSLNLISPLINLAVLWTIPYLLRWGMVLGILGMLGRVGILAYLLYPLLFYLEKVIDLCSKWTVFQWEAPKIGWWFAVVYYLGIWRWVKRKI